MDSRTRTHPRDGLHKSTLARDKRARDQHRGVFCAAGVCRTGKSAVRVAHRGYGALDLRQNMRGRHYRANPARARHVSCKDYLCWVRAHPAKDWYCPQYILYGENDSMTDLATIRTYTAKSGAELIIVPQGEHWFHTPEQLAVMADWERKHK